MGQIDHSKQGGFEMPIKTRRVIEDLTVIIPTVGRPILQKCLESISRGNVLPALIIVVDQGDNPLVLEWIQDLRNAGLEIFHLKSSERSPSSARNRGIEQVKTTFAAATDDDCLAEVDWLEKMDVLLHKNPKTIVTGRLEPAGDGIPPTVVTSETPCLYTRPSLRILSPLASANMGFDVQTAQKIGKFDGKLSAAEENDWAYRALKAGISILYAPELIVYHVHWRDKQQMVSTYQQYAWFQGAFYGKHLRNGDFSMLIRTAITYYRGVKDFLIGVIKNDDDRKSNGYARLAYLLSGVFAGLRGL